MFGSPRAASVALSIAGILANVVQSQVSTDIITASLVALNLTSIGRDMKNSSAEFRKLGQNLAEYSIVESMDQINKSLSYAFEEFPGLASFEHGMERLRLELRFVENAFNKTIRFIEAETRGDRKTSDSQKFADEIFSENDGLPKRLLNIRNIVSQDVDGIVSILVKQMRNQKTDCTSSLSHQQHLYEMFTHLLLTELKSYLTMLYCSQLKSNTTGINFTIGENDIDKISTERISNTIKTFRDLMRTTSRRIWRCDPAEHKKDKTYTELNHVFSRIILHELDLSQKKLACSGNCEIFKENVTYQCHSHGDICAKQRGCKKVADCGNMDNARVCLSDKVNNTKRYQYVDKYERTWRNMLQSFMYSIGFADKKCPNYLASTDSYSRGSSDEVCFYCGCICTESSDQSDRYFNLRPTESDIEQNFVVTGMRFKKKHHVVHIQIQQGKLSSDGMTDPTTVHWKHIDGYTVSGDDGLNVEKGVKPHVVEWFGKRKVIFDGTLSENGLKYHKLEWFGKRKVILNHIESPENHVVTGVRFVTENNGTEVNLKLQIRSTLYNATTGELFKEQFIWHSSEDNEKRTELQLNGYTNPIRSGQKTILDSNDSQYLQFHPTGIMTEDAGQSTIPFLDLQSVGSRSSAAITGVGLIHKGAGKSGGYLALKVNTFDAVSHLDVLIKQMEKLGLIVQSSNEEISYDYTIL